MQATERLWRTADGKLVRDGDEAGTSLAYTPGDEVAPKDEALMPGDGKASDQAEDKGTAKAAPKPADKAAARPDNK